MTIRTLPDVRIRTLNRAAPRPTRRGRSGYVLYWMTAARRTRYNPALERAVNLAEMYGCGVVVLEALRADYPWASERMHAFVIDGMRDNQRAFANTAVHYYPYVEPKTGAARGLLEAFVRRARVVVTDDFPAFFLPRMVQSAARILDVRLEAIDGNGLYPMYATERVFTTAASFRIHLQKHLGVHLGYRPRTNPLARRSIERITRLPAALLRRWPATRLDVPNATLLTAMPIDHSVLPAPVRGGMNAGRRALNRFLQHRLDRYEHDRNVLPGEAQGARRRDLAQSELSAYLHFGHLSVHEMFAALARREDWSVDRLSPTPTRRRTGWWGMSPPAEAFLDQLVTWRELGYNMCAHRPDDYARYESLPLWARTTLEQHAGDPRPHLYDLDAFELARTHDPLWNAAQTQLVRDGRIHNYLRMLWGKKILEWCPSARIALDVMVHLNNKYALDGRNPNSYSGIFWILGRYDRAWGPERAIFGKVRYMSSESAARKLKVSGYLERYCQASPGR